MKALEVGDEVVCRYWNKIDRKHYGNSWTGTIVHISPAHKFNAIRVERGYLVTMPESSYPDGVWIHRNEILCRVKE